MSALSPVRAIQTEYNGYLFRSRLEARWAVFFDVAGIPYQYEVEGFEVGRFGRYLPDFWLPEYRYWIEIKGVAPTDNETEKLRLVAKASDSAGAFIFWGDIPYPDPASRDVPSDSAIRVFPYWDIDHRWCECAKCGRVGVEFEGRAERLCDCFDSGGTCIGSVSCCGGQSLRRLQRACKAARSARFSRHGW